MTGLLQAVVVDAATPAVLGVYREMLGFEFMQRALLAGLLVGILAPLVGSFLVHRRMAFIGDTLAHVAFAGVAAGLFARSALGYSQEFLPFLTALVVAALAAVLIQAMADYADVYNDVSMAIVLSGGFAIGTVLVSLSGGIAVSINQYLFGGVTRLSWTDVYVLAGLTVLVVGIVVASYKQLLYSTIDERAARVARMDVDRTNYLLVVLAALVIVGAMQVLGVILVAAMLVVPVAAAGQIAPTFRSSILIAIVIAQLSTVSGITFSYTNDLAASGSMVLVAIGLYVIAVIFGRRFRIGQ
ncbi:metal ABC transporter permease [Salinarchaeum laminariae]|uniref:metal ABC transporter permease n=1 Tax=Salinarchaeum laminariae TaxID=869888 RepID=UPI0020BE86C9|nr:metal ABC transporter permease [Salinarchaeum laminariae]